jgi:hypothetical protein
MGERRGVYRLLVGRPEGKRPLGRPRLRWEDNTKMVVQEVGCGDRDRLQALVNTITNLRVPQNAGTILTGLKLISFSGRTLLHRVSQYVSR